MKSTEEILARNILKANYDIDPDNVKGVYPYGSILYETTTDKSDLDLVVIVDMIKNDYLQYESEDLDIHFMSEKHYKNILKEHDIMALECFYNPSPYLAYPVEFELDKVELRKVISARCGNSWSKARKKLEIEEEDDYIGLKSLFHSFRMLSFGIDLAGHDKIWFKDVGGVPADKFWNDILYHYKSGYRWEELKELYKSRHNQMATDFRKLAPKE